MAIFKILLLLSAILTVTALLSACADAPTKTEKELSARERVARLLHETRGNMSDLEEAIDDLLQECSKKEAK